MKRWLPFLLMFVIGAAACSEKFKEALEEERKATENLSLTLAVNSASIKLGDMTARFTATANYKEKGSQDVTGSCVFKIDNPAIIEIGQSGQVYPKSEGSTNVSFSYDNETSNTVSFTVADSTGPVIIVAQTQDLDHDGVLDAVKVFFSEPVKDSSVNVSAWSIAGVTGLHFDPTTDGDAPDDMIIYLTFMPNSQLTTENLLSIAVSNNAVADLGLNSIMPTTMNAVDGAPPVCRWNRAGSGSTVLTLFFSEPVFGTRSSAGCPDLSLAAGNFRYTNVSGDGADRIVSVNNRCGTNVVELTLDVACHASDVADTIGNTTQAIFDAAGNEVISFNSTLAFNQQQGYFTNPGTYKSTSGDYRPFVLQLTTGSDAGKYFIIQSDSSSSTYLMDPITGNFHNCSSPSLLSGSAGLASYAFQLVGGANAKKWVIVHGFNDTKTSVLDESTLVISEGKQTGVSNSTGANAVRMASGRWLVIHGGGSTATSLLDEADSALAFVAHPTPLPFPSGKGCHSIKITTGPKAGLWLIVLGNGQKNAVYFNESAMTFTATTLPYAVSLGGHAFKIATGAHAGKWLIASGENNVNTIIYDESSDTFVQGPVQCYTTTNAISSFEIKSGTYAGRRLFIYGGRRMTTWYDGATNSFTMGPLVSSSDLNLAGLSGFFVPSGVQAGKWIIYAQSDGHFIFDEINSTFFLERSMSSIYAGSMVWYNATGVHAGKWLIVKGYLGQTQLYDEITGGWNNYAESPSVMGDVGSGGHMLLPTLGTYAGKPLLVLGNNNEATSVYDPTIGQFVPGPSLTKNAKEGSHSFRYAPGKWLVVIGNTTLETNLFDEATSTFSDGPALYYHNVNDKVWNGCSTINIQSGTCAGRFITIHCTYGSYGGPVTSMFNPATVSYVNGPTLRANPVVGTISFRIDSGVHAGKWIILHGNGLKTSTLLDESKLVEDPAHINDAISDGPPLTENLFQISKAYYIDSGLYNGRWMVICANNKTNIYNPTTGLFEQGPDTQQLTNSSNCLMFKLKSGPRTGQHVLVSGWGASMNYFVP